MPGPAKTLAEWLLALLIGFLIGTVAHPFWHGPQVNEVHHYAEKVVRDTVRHAPVYFPVPGPERLRVDTHFVGGGEAQVIYQPVVQTVYADCDSARRYTSEYSDSVVRITCASDVCGKVLASNLAYECFRKTILRTETIEKEYARHRLYAVANSAPGLGLAYATPRWVAGYSYQLGHAPSGYQAHQVQIGINLFSKRHDR